MAVRQFVNTRTPLMHSLTSDEAHNRQIAPCYTKLLSGVSQLETADVSRRLPARLRRRRRRESSPTGCAFFLVYLSILRSVPVTGVLLPRCRLRFLSAQLVACSLTTAHYIRTPLHQIIGRTRQCDTCQSNHTS